MKPSSETHLHKLETFHGRREARLFVIRGETPTQRDAYVADLIRSGEAMSSDTFIYTGVPRFRGNGSTVHDEQGCGT